MSQYVLANVTASVRKLSRKIHISSHVEKCSCRNLSLEQNGQAEFSTRSECINVT
jgi:hypothetical protein